MEVLLLLTIFLDVHMAVGWNQNIPPPRPPKPQFSLLSPVQKFFSLLKPAQKYPPAPVGQFPPAIRNNPPSEDDLSPFNDDWLDYDFGNDLWETKPKPESPNCVSTAMVASGLTAVILLSIFTLIVKVIPSFFAPTLTSPLQMLANAAVESWMPVKKYTPPNVIHNYAWPPGRYSGGWPSAREDLRYGGSNPYLNAPRGRYSPFRRAENSPDYQ
ncbi:uncharacterized protein LOC107037350 isoform X2 [Diachasma alloeum]|uniref:uncharacterized protein LOC107037350 isoform X2 n=1 Tax=Diachasma alloeum TaxID=454923 RepID=UPI00073841B2|nr:uncharacterized protein LOC107037350 isoform X2 [Diachasma alloeum]